MHTKRTHGRKARQQASGKPTPNRGVGRESLEGVRGERATQSGIGRAGDAVGVGGGDSAGMHHSTAPVFKRGNLRSAAQFTSGRRDSQRMPVSSSMSGHISAGTPSFFQRETEALDTGRGLRSERRRASSVVPLAARQADSSGEREDEAMVSENYTPEFSLAKLWSRNKVGVPYALLMGFKERLREARDARGLSGQALGSKLAVSKATISHWENGRYEPNLEQMKALCDELRVSADWLLDRTGVSLTADALQEAQAYEALSPEDRRKWRAVRRTMFATI